MSSARAAFDHAVEEVRKDYKDIDDGSDLLEKIVTSFEKSFANPQVTDFERIIGKTFTREEVIVALFHPREEQIRYYPIILHVTTQLPKGSTFVDSRTQGMVLSLLYLVHRKSWTFLEEFVIRGGLDSIATMINDPNLYYRGQVLEILLSVTDSDKFDWFKPHNGDVTIHTLHNRLLSLSENPAFLTGLLANRVQSYPGGSFRALQILAFWISWVRAVMTKNQQLTLSTSMLEEIRLWGQDRGQEGTESCEEEMRLASTVYQDFSYDQFHRDDDPDVKVPASAAAGDGGGDGGGIGSNSYNVSGFDRPEFEGLVVDALPSSTDINKLLQDHAHLSPSDDAGNAANGDCNSSSSSSSSSMKQRAGVLDDGSANAWDQANISKEEGNASFKGGNYEGALVAYRLALSLLNSKSSSADTSEVRQLKAALHFNIATALWKLIESSDTGVMAASSGIVDVSAVSSSSSSSSGLSKEQLLVDCESSCRAALCSDPLHSKAVYRLCAILVRMDRPEEALTTIRSFPGEIDGVLKAMRRQCLVAVLASHRQDADETPTDNGDVTTTALNGSKKKASDDALIASTLGKHAAKYLKALQARSGRETKRVAHAWDGWTAPTEHEKENNNDNDQGDEGDDDDDHKKVDEDEASSLQHAKAAQATDDAFLLQLMTGQTNSHTVAAATTTTTIKKMMPAVVAVVDGRDQKKGKKTKTAGPLSRISVDAYNIMKVLSISYERHLHTSSTAATTTACNEDEKIQTMLNEATKALHTIWDEGASLKAVFASSLEEPLMHLLLILATTRGGGVSAVSTANNENNSTGHSDNSDNLSSINLSKKLLQQLVSVDRFATVLQLTLFGNDALNQAVRETVDQFIALEPPTESKLLSSLSKWKCML